MADRSNDERLREIIEGTYIGFDEGAAIAAKLLAAQVHRDRLAATLVDVQRELLAARAEVERLQGIIDDVESESGHCLFLNDEEHEPPHLPDHVRAIVQERDAVRAQLQADDQRAWETLGKPEGTHDTTNVQRLCAEVERLRADMREAVELLESASPNMGDAEWDEWGSKVNKLLAKHKETP